MAYPTEGLKQKTLVVAKNLNVNIKNEMVLCSDMFYAESEDVNIWRKKGAACVEMESFVLYKIAEEFNKNAVCLLTISDLLYDHETYLTAEERQSSFNDMIKLALEIAVQN